MRSSPTTKHLIINALSMEPLHMALLKASNLTVPRPDAYQYTLPGVETMCPASSASGRTGRKASSRTRFWTGKPECLERFGRRLRISSSSCTCGGTKKQSDKGAPNYVAGLQCCSISPCGIYQVLPATNISENLRKIFTEALFLRALNKLSPNHSKRAA